MDKKYEELKEKVVQFQMMELPGQPRSMHIGTWYLVSELWREIKRLRKVIDDCDLKNNISFGEEYER